MLSRVCFNSTAKGAVSYTPKYRCDGALKRFSIAMNTAGALRNCLAASKSDSELDRVHGRPGMNAYQNPFESSAVVRHSA